MTRLKDNRQQEIPAEMEEWIDGFNLKSNHIFYNSDYSELINDVFLMKHSKSDVKDSLNYFLLPVSHEKSIILVSYSNPAGEGIISYTECPPRIAEVCLRAMGDKPELTDTIKALNIPVAPPIIMTRTRALRLDLETLTKIRDSKLLRK